ncbi:MAG: SPOR domain-containing protein [Hyphomicrobiaceae bacterium]|nr:SPOR domain-containing protein [Hyphomicrobiaceae bacterium]
MARPRTAVTLTIWNRPIWNCPIWIWAAVLAVGLLAGSAAATAAKSKTGESPAGAAAEAERTIDTGVAALEAGKADLAAQELTSAISGGKISQPNLARALYYRGVAYRKQGKPAQAIADFTSALWIKNGLDHQQRSDALLNRAGAYRDAGLTDQAEADEKRVAASAAAPRQGATAPATPAASRPQEAAAPAASGGGLGSFFSALFGGSPASQEPVSQGFATSVSAPETSGRPARPPPPASVSAWSTQSNPSAAGWADSTEVSKVDRRQAAATPATTGSTGAPVTKAVARAPARDDRYHIQVAAVRSRQEAQSVAARLKQIGAAGSRERDAAIEETVMGNMGTLYLVRLGPFASTGEMQSVCPRLRDAGLDCLIIGQ